MPYHKHSTDKTVRREKREWRVSSKITGRNFKDYVTTSPQVAESNCATKAARLFTFGRNISPIIVRGKTPSESENSET